MTAGTATGTTLVVEIFFIPIVRGEVSRSGCLRDVKYPADNPSGVFTPPGGFRPRQAGYCSRLVSTSPREHAGYPGGVPAGSAEADRCR